MKWLWVAMVVAGVAVVGIAASQETGLGITIHAEGTLGEVKQMLRDEHRMYLSLRGDFDENTPVKLDLDGVTRLQLVRDICQQIGAVYGIHGGGRMYHMVLHEGDLSLDPRPTTMAGPYTVSVRDISIGNSRSMRFRLGAEAGEAGMGRERLSIEFDVESPTAATEALLFGIWPQASIVLDTGERLINLNGAARSYPVHRLDIHGGGGAMGLRFTLPEESPTRITQLNGVVAAYRELTHASCQFSPDEIGVTKQVGDVGCKLTGWDRLLDEITVRFEMPAGTGSLDDRSMQVRTRLLGPNEETARVGSRGRRGSHEKSVFTHGFRDVEWEPVAVTIETTVWHGPMVWHNFVIEDIPLP